MFDVTKTDCGWFRIEKMTCLDSMRNSYKTMMKAVPKNTYLKLM